MAIPAGTRMGSYEILSLLGAGGMGEIYRARDLKLGRVVALKVLPTAVSADTERRARFEQEAFAVSRLNHPNIVTIHELGSADGVLFVVMELVEGRTLRALLEAGPVPALALLDIAVQVADGLAKAHGAGIVHRDLKPENLMVSEDGFVKILDFGLAKLTTMPEDLSGLPTLPQHGTHPGTVLGTVAYMSPEQARGAAVDFRSDQFALGTILYEMTAGRRPFQRASAAETLAAIIHESPEPLGRLSPVPPPSLSGIVERCLAKPPEERYTSTLTLARELRDAREHLSDPAPATAAPRGRRSLLLRAAVTVVVLGAMGLTAWLLDQRRRVRWAREEALPEIARLAEKRSFVEAVRLARQAAAVIPSDPALARLWPDIVAPATFETTPSGADVYLKAYSSPDAEWEHTGRTPLEDISIPMGLLRYEIRKAGYRTVVGAIGYDIGSFRMKSPRELKVSLDEEGRLPPGMARVPGGRFGLRMAGLDNVAEASVDDFLMDVREVTNREFKGFVDAGGYREKKYWKHDFVKEGRKLSWQEGIAALGDRIGRPGPATWELGAYPAGSDELPVSGVSWHEAAAYAEFAGKSLPTIYHWNHAASGMQLMGRIIPLSNVGGSGLVATAPQRGMSVYGIDDMAGNVKEWCWNGDGHGGRYVLGGAWNEPAYMFSDPDAQEPFTRSENIGFRCVKALAAPVADASIFREVEWRARDYLLEEPVPEAIFDAYKRLYSYDKTGLDARIDSADDSAEHWTTQKVSFNAAYGGERVLALLYLPRAFRPPHQPVVFFPGAGALYLESIDQAGDIAYLDSVIRSGRAVLYPVYKYTYERRVGSIADTPSPTSVYRDRVIQWSKDLGRAIDYLETRDDVDARALGYYGHSWGAAMGAILPAVEGRIRASVLVAGGLEATRALPEVEAVNFAPRVRVPTLMINGRYDGYFGVEVSQVPMFRLLGTKASDKRHVVYDSGHAVPRELMVKEILDWLDRYLGPVERQRHR